MGEPDKPPNLPAGAPAELRDFVACRRLTIELALDQIGWMPKPKNVPAQLAPSASATAGPTPNSAEVSVGWGFVSITLPVSVAGGRLVVDTAHLPNLEGMKDGIDNWVGRFNDTMRANGKRLDGLTVRGNKVVLTKVAVAATGSSPAAPSSATPTPTPTPSPSGSGSAQSATTTPPSITTPPAAPDKPGKGCIAAVLGGLILVGAGVAVYSATRDGDDNVATAPPAIVTPAPASGPPPPTLPPPTLPPPGESPPPPSSSTTTTSSSTTTTSSAPAAPTVAPVAAVPCPSTYTNEEYWDAPGGGGQLCNSLPVGGYLAGSPASPFPPLIVFSPTVGILHAPGDPDVVTGRPGLSQALLPFEIYWDAEGNLTVASDCGGDVGTGLAAAVPGVPFVLSQPLFHFGPCTVTTVVFQSGADRFDLSALFDAAGITYDVSSNEVPVPSIGHEPWTLDTDFEKMPTWGDYSAVVLDGLQDGRERCTFFGQPGSDSLVLPCDEPGGTLRFTPGLASPGLSPSSRVFSHGAGWLNPLGIPAPNATDLGGFTTAPLFGNSVFPCGPGALGLTVCAEGHEHTDSGGYVVVSIVAADNVPLEPDDPLAFEVAVTGGQTYRLQGTGGEWALTSPGDTDARFVIRGDSVTLVVPQREIGAADRYVLSTESGGERFAQPETPIVGVLSLPEIALGADQPPTTDAAAPAETPESFFAALTASLSSGDTSFAFQRLHPLVLDTFGAEACGASLLSRVEPGFAVTVVDVGAIGPWTWALPDGRTFDVPVAQTVTIDLTRAGATTRSEGHLVDLDGHYRWFTICD